MTDDGRLLRLLTEVLDGYPDPASDRLLVSVLAGVRTTPQRPRWRSMRGWLRFVPAAITQHAAGALLVVVVVVVLALVRQMPQGQIAGRGNPMLSPTPSSTVSPTPSRTAPATRRSAFAGTAVAIEDTSFVSGVAYTSSAFRPQIAFRLGAQGPKEGTAQETNWCSPPGSDGLTLRTSPRTIVLAWRFACVSDLRFIRPFAVDCDTPDAHPDAATLAAAILARPGIGNVHDRGTLQTPGAVPPNLFFGTYQGRVLEIIRSRDLAPNDADPDGCRLLAEPGTGDPTIEIRGDQSATLVLVDVNSELVVVRAAPAGYDGPTGAAAEALGYGNIEVMDAMLKGIYDVEFR